MKNTSASNGKTYYVYEVTKTTKIVVPYVSEELDIISNIMANKGIIADSIQAISANNAIEALLKAGIDEDDVLDILIEEVEFAGISALVEFDLIGKEFL